MAITIDGSANTVAGLAVGGLPDGVVDKDSIAADAVDGTRLADNAVESEHVAAGALDIAHLSSTGTAGSGNYLRGDNSWQAAGGGKILKAEHGKNTSTHSTTSNHPQDAFTFTFTPTSASSTVIIHMMLPVDLNISTEIQIVGKFSIHKNDDTQLAGTWLGQQHEYMNRNSSGHAPTCTANLMMIAKDTPGSTSEQTYKLKFGRQSGYNCRVAIRDHNFGGSAFGCMWSIFEVE